MAGLFLQSLCLQDEQITIEEKEMRKYSILFVDDDPFIIKATGDILKLKGYGVTTAESGERAIELLENATFDLIITDLIMGSIDGIGVLKKAKEISPETMVMILTGFGDMASAIEALRSDADDYILKPCESDEIYFRVSKCLEKLELKRKLKLYENILPVCCVCKKIRDDSGMEPKTGNWMQMENYIRDMAGVNVTTTFCPECAKKEKEKIRGGFSEA
jgi:DNA-binding NtrC family response regulator